MSSLLRSLGLRAREAGLAVRLAHRSGVLAGLSASALRWPWAARGLRLGPDWALAYHALNTPDKTAVVCGDLRLSFLELHREVSRAAQALRAGGVRGGDRVAVMLPNCAEHVVAQLAVPRAGATLVEMGTRLSQSEIAYLLENANPTAWIHHDDFQGIADSIPSPAFRLVVGREGSWAESLAEHSGDDAPRARASGGVMLYTSGTTGKPKGATRKLEGMGVTPALEMMLRLGVHATDRHLVVCPLYHSAAPAFTMTVLLMGGTVHILPKFSPEAVLDSLSADGITCSFMVPTMLKRLAEHGTGPIKSQLRWVLSGAAPLPRATAEAFQGRFGACLWNFYGATELGLVSMAGPSEHSARPGTVGRLLPGNRVLILDEDGRECLPGEVGELFVSNEMLIDSYFGNPSATAKAMRGGHFSVGDMARLDDAGYLYLESRKHDMIISGGVNIYPREVEDCLLAHPLVTDAAVLGVPDADWGESIRAFVVTPSGDCDASELIAHCESHLARFKRPRSVVFVDEIPRNATGKILRRELRQW